MITPVWIIGFTGHRPKDTFGRTAAELTRLAPTVRAELQRLKAKAEAQHGRADFLCGMAAGADIIAAREAEALGMIVHVIPPMPESEFAKDFAEPGMEDDWKEAQRFIALARAGTGGATLRLAHGSHLRDDCYYDLGVQIVNASDALIALWDGKDTPITGGDSGRGGTADVVAMAMANRTPYVRANGTESLVLLATPVRFINSLTGEVMGEVDHFAHTLDAGISVMRAVAHIAEREPGGDRRLDSVAEFNRFSDQGAKNLSVTLWRGQICGIALIFTASLIAAVSAGAQQSLGEWTPPVLAALELTLVSVAIGIMAWAHLKHAQAKWLELRLATELTRALVGAGRLLDPLFPLATDHLPGWRRFCISVGLTVWSDPISQVGEPGDSREQVFEKQKERYLTARIEDQLKHFTVNDPHEKHWWHGVAHIAGPVTAGLAVIFAAIALVHRWDVALHGGSEHHTDFFGSVINYFLPIALPVMAGALLTISRSAETRRRERSYPNIVERLRAARDWLHAIRTPRELRNFVARVEKIFLDELVDWYQTDRRETR